MAVMARAEPTRRFFHASYVTSGFQGFWLFSIAFQACKQGAGMKVEQLECELVPNEILALAR